MIKKSRNRITQKRRLDVWRRDNFKCVYCSTSYSVSNRLSLDHVVPLYSGGDNSVDNLVTSCERCNKAKGSLSVQEFAKILDEERV